MLEVKVPASTQGPALSRKMPGQRKREETLLPERSTMTTRSMQKKKSLAPRITIGSLPNISGLLVQAIAMCQSDNGLSFTELKEVLSTKGYNVSRHCPRIKKKLQALVSKGALVRMTRSNGSTFFVVKKYPEKSSNVFESSEKNVGRQKAKVENRNAMYVPSKAKRPSKGGKNPDSKNRGKKAQSLNKKLNAGEKQQKRSRRKRRSVKRVEGPDKNVLPATKRSSRSRSKAVLITKREKQPSSDRTGSSSKKPQRPRKRAASSSEKPKSPVEKFKRSGFSDSKLVLSARGLESPYRQEMLSLPRARPCRSENTSLPKGKRISRSKAGFPPQGPMGNVKSSTKKQRRQR